MASYGFSLYSIDFVSAFLNAVSDPNMYVTPPTGVNIQDGYCWKLLRALYGTARAPRLWHKTLEKLLNSLLFTRSVADACMYFRKTDEHTEIIFFHVDDLILCTVPQKAKDFISSVKKKFSIHDLGFPTEVLGIQVRRDKAGIYLSTEKSERKIIKEFEMDETMILETPLPPGYNLPSLDEVPDAVVIDKYRRLLGKLLYLSRCVRYDICYSINLLSRYSTRHNKSMWKAMKGILRYLKQGNFEICYTYNKNPKITASNITAWSDASFSDDTSTRRSTIGLFVFWNGYIISWNSSKTKKVALSSTESEFIAAAEALKTAINIRNISKQLYSHESSLSLLVDNQSCVKWLKNPTGYHAKTKHIDVCYHFAREMFNESLLSIHYVSTSKQLADILTKSLSKAKHRTIIDSVSSFSSSGGILDATSLKDLEKAA